MKKMLAYGLAAALGLTGVMETAPSATAAGAETAPRSLEQLRETVRAEAMASLAGGQIDTVRHRRWHRKRYRHRARHRARWCGYKRYYGRRCYYTPYVLRPFRQR